MERWSGRVALVTGASEGIGAAIVKALVGHGLKVVACARSLDKLQKLQEDLKSEKGSRREVYFYLMFSLVRLEEHFTMDRWVGRVALVTGASAGLGAEFVRTLVHHGMKVVGCARNVESIQKIKEECKSEKGSVYPIKCDLTKEEDILKMFKEIKNDSNLGGVDVCINNAGLSHNAPLLSGKTEDWANILNGVSPGVIETEFSERMNKSQEKAKELYSSMKCMVPKDIADTILFILKSPPHVEINDIFMRPTEQTG